MCGIAGVVHSSPDVRACLRESLKQLVHRGPDDSGVYEHGRTALGMTRLSVIDVAGGHQPIVSVDENLAIVFNGEIYNYLELREELRRAGRTFRTNSDTEVILHLYDVEGLDFVSRLRGMFAIAIHDVELDRVVLARDRLGKKPLYYASPTPDSLIFASELKALGPLERAAGLERTLRPQAIYDYLSLGVITQPATIFEGVQSLPAGSIGVTSPGGLEISSYWQPEFYPKTELSYAEAQIEARRHIREAVRIRLRSDVPLGVFLSGGLDSSIVALEAVNSGAVDLQTFTVSTGHGLDESGVAQRTAARLGIKNTVLPLEVDPLTGVMDVVRHYDQPYADSSAIPSMQISKLGREHVTVILNGDGGDEIFGGYRRYAAAAAMGRLRDLGLQRVAGALPPLGDPSKQRRSRLGLAQRLVRGFALDYPDRYLVWSSDMLREIDKQGAWRGGAVLPSERLVADTQRPGFSDLDQLNLTDLSLNLQSDLLVKMDMATMRHSLEGRSPFLDDVVAEFGWRLPDKYRVRGRVTKRILRDAYRGQLNDEVIHGAKKGFEVHMANWLAGPLKSVLHDTVGSGTARVREILDGRLIDDLISGAEGASKNRTFVLYALLVLELWLAESPRRGSCFGE